MAMTAASRATSSSMSTCPTPSTTAPLHRNWGPKSSVLPPDHQLLGRTVVKRRLIAALVAIVLAGISALVLVNYVSGADQRAMAGMQTTTVYVVTAPIAAGTAVSDLAESITTKAIPQSALASGAVTNLSQITGKVTTT